MPIFKNTTGDDDSISPQEQKIIDQYEKCKNLLKTTEDERQQQAIRNQMGIEVLMLVMTNASRLKSTANTASSPMTNTKDTPAPQ